MALGIDLRLILFHVFSQCLYDSKGLSVSDVICKFVSGLILWFLRNPWFDDLCEE